MDATLVMNEERKYCMQTFGRLPIVLDHGSGAYAYDVNGTRYLDFLAGIAVNLLGHNHPRLTQAISCQAGKMVHCSNIFYNEPQVLLAKKLVELSGIGPVFFANSGAEANEGAIKLARKYAAATGKYEIITAVHSFHGRTMATLSATGQPKYQQGFAPILPGFSYVPFNDFDALCAAVTPRTCAVMLEPIQGEGGVYPATHEYLQAVRKLCDEQGLLLIFDEVQTGMARTGKMFAFQHYQVTPDILTLAKGLGGGVPVGAFLAKPEVAAAFKPGDHGSTFGGNPLACSAALAILAVIEDEHLLQQVQKVGAYLRKQLQGLQARYPHRIKEVRGYGLMVGMELDHPGKDIVNCCLAKGLIINCTAGQVLRFVPPLIIGTTQVDECMNIIEQAFQETE